MKFSDDIVLKNSGSEGAVVHWIYKVNGQRDGKENLMSIDEM